MSSDISLPVSHNHVDVLRQSDLKRVLKDTIEDAPFSKFLEHSRPSVRRDRLFARSQDDGFQLQSCNGVRSISRRQHRRISTGMQAFLSREGPMGKRISGEIDRLWKREPSLRRQPLQDGHNAWGRRQSPDCSRVRMAPPTFADRSAPAQASSGTPLMASDWSAPVRMANFRFAPVRIVKLRLAFVRFALPRSAPVRFALLRSEFVRSALTRMA
jgi:hypothetical protein